MNMFIPHLFREEDEAEINRLLDDYPFGMLVTALEGKIVASHIPMLRRTIAGKMYITSHLAKENEQVKAIEQELNDVLAIFQGPHAYVSSSWYKSENVPTWNYQAVHVYGKLLTVTKEQLIDDLTLLLEKFEQGRERAVLWDALSEATKRQVDGIVGFRLRVEKIEAVSKLSQNRNDIDYNRIIEKLETGSEMERLVAEEMKKRRS